jgi:hypothetical protein
LGFNRSSDSYGLRLERIGLPHFRQLGKVPRLVTILKSPAWISYYFRSKEGVYEAIVSEAGFQFVAEAERIGKHSNDASPEVRLRSLVGSPFRNLCEGHSVIRRHYFRLSTSTFRMHEIPTQHEPPLRHDIIVGHKPLMTGYSFAERLAQPVR